MQITPLAGEEKEFSRQLLYGWRDGVFTVPPPRPGVHVSELVGYIAQMSGVQAYKDKGYGLEDDAEGMLRASSGLMWEDVFTWAMKERLGIVQFPVTRDGITGTIDGVNKDGLVEETKATWKNEANAINDSWRWMKQILSYSFMLGCGGAYLRILHLSPYPRTRFYRLTFSAQELTDNWQMMLAHRDIFMQARGMQGVRV